MPRNRCVSENVIVFFDTCKRENNHSICLKSRLNIISKDTYQYIIIRKFNIYRLICLKIPLSRRIWRI